MRGEAALVSEAGTSLGLATLRPVRARLRRRHLVCILCCHKTEDGTQVLISIYSLRFLKWRDIFQRWIFPDTNFMDLRTWSWFMNFRMKAKYNVVGM